MNIEVEGETFIPDIVPPELKSVPAPVGDAPKPPVKASVPTTKGKENIVAVEPIHIHHTIVGIAIAGASLAALFIPQLKPITRVAVAGIGITLGAVIIYDDILQHAENDCPLDTIWNFTPCKEPAVTVVKKP